MILVEDDDLPRVPCWTGQNKQCAPRALIACFVLRFTRETGELAHPASGWRLAPWRENRLLGEKELQHRNDGATQVLLGHIFYLSSEGRKRRDTQFLREYQGHVFLSPV